jgi:hypothetical protein
MPTKQTSEPGAEQTRLEEDREGRAAWKKWGPYLSERQWGTVREDYSSNGDAWNYFTHDHAQYRAYRWGEDGLAGLSDDRQLLCFALALWNGRDPILKERFQDQGGLAAKLQDKVEEIVMEKVAEAVQKKAEEVQQEAEQGTEEKKEVL